MVIQQFFQTGAGLVRPFVGSGGLIDLRLQVTQVRIRKLLCLACQLFDPFLRVFTVIGVFRQCGRLLFQPCLAAHVPDRKECGRHVFQGLKTASGQGFPQGCFCVCPAVFKLRELLLFARQVAPEDVHLLPGIVQPLLICLDLFLQIVPQILPAKDPFVGSGLVRILQLLLQLCNGGAQGLCLPLLLLRRLLPPGNVFP